MKLKKTLMGLTLGSLLFGNVSNLNAEALKLPGLPEKPQTSEMWMNNYGTILEDAYLFHYDEYTQTKYALNTGYMNEADPIARSFFDKNLWNLAYVAAVGSLILGDALSKKVDPSGKLAEVVNTTTGILDFLVILSNYTKLKDSFGKSLPNKQRNLPILSFDIQS